MSPATEFLGSKIDWRKLDWRYTQRHVLQLAGATAGLLLLAFLYINFNVGSSTMSEAVRVNNKTQSCIGFDPATVSKKLDSSIKTKQHSYNNAEISEFVCSIMNHDMNLTARLDCAESIDSRYEHLRPSPSGTPRIQYFFALDLYQSVHIILPLMGSILQAIRYLGPEYCALSIVEGRSTDGTYAILAGLKTELAAMGVPYFLVRDYLDPKAGGENRITALSHLRNLALEPLLAESKSKHSRLAPKPTIIFVNDIVICPEDILELIHQRVIQSASMTCGFDWNKNAGNFYDAWVSRSMSGNLFFEVTHDGKHWLGDDMFFDHPDSVARWDQSLPIQVYSCWGGMVTLDAEPFIKGSVTFRSSEKEECYMGEPMTLAKDLWKLGRGQILAVPAVNTGYEYDQARDAKGRRGYVHEIVNHTQYNTEAELVKWEKNPPPMVKCMPVFERQWWTTPV